MINLKWNNNLHFDLSASPGYSHFGFRISEGGSFKEVACQTSLRHRLSDSAYCCFYLKEEQIPVVVEAIGRFLGTEKSKSPTILAV